MANESKVKIVGKDNRVIFSVTPSSLSESRTANYEAWSLVHLPVDLFAYRNTTSRTWELSAPLVSRTVKEAEANSKILNTVRSWLQPDFAASGAPPEILKFSAYDDPNIADVTCVIRSYTWNYPTDVDYVYLAKHKMPIISQLGISIMEVYSAAEIQKAYPWQMIGTGTDLIQNPSGFGLTPPNFTSNNNPTFPNLPLNGFPTSGDPLNVLRDLVPQPIRNIISDPISGLRGSLPPVVIPNGFFGGGE